MKTTDGQYAEVLDWLDIGRAKGACQNNPREWQHLAEHSIQLS